MHFALQRKIYFILFYLKKEGKLEKILIYNEFPYMGLIPRHAYAPLIAVDNYLIDKNLTSVDILWS